MTMPPASCKSSDFPNHTSSCQWQEFAMITPDQKKQLEKFFVSQGPDFMMSPDEFLTELLDLVRISVGEVVRYPIIRCGDVHDGHVIYNFVNVVLDYDASNPETTHKATHVGPGKWKKVIQENPIDCLIPDCDSSGKGVVVGRFGVFPHKKCLPKLQSRVVFNTYKGRGLKRYRTDHFGIFVM